MSTQSVKRFVIGRLKHLADVPGRQTINGIGSKRFTASGFFLQDRITCGIKKRDGSCCGGYLCLKLCRNKE
jgi:hypothetical protein